MPIATVLLRIFTILFAAGCVVVLILDKTTDVDGSKVTFKNVIAYRLIRGGFLPAFDFYGDKVMAFLLATGVGAGFLVTVELKEFLGDLFKEFGADLKDSPFESFFNKGYLAVSLLAGAFLCMAVLSVFSSLQRTTISGRGFFR
ncbi:hypothetical protein QQP08_011169 [Theobroma cacao]|nr:hypothetical protein QQP08_011169 [Theobroma cacao]